MSFFDTLQGLGLFKNQGNQAPPPADGAPQSSPSNPYGLDEATRRAVGWQTLGNISQQLLVLGQQMRPQDRVQLMSNMDLTGGYQTNLANAAQQRLAMRKAQIEDQNYQRQEEARVKIGQTIKALPAGPLKEAATYFYTAGDLAKAGELLWTRTQRMDPMTGQMVQVDALGNVIGPAQGDILSGGPLPAGGGAPGGAPDSSGGGTTPASPSPSAASPGAPAPMPAPAADGGQVDQMTRNWRRLLQDPTLTPQEVRIIASQGSQEKALSKYGELVKQRQDSAGQQATRDQTALSNNRTAADALTDEFNASTKSYDTIIGAGQRAVQVANDSNMSPSAKLTTLYQFMKALDPDGAVREGDVAMAQAMQSIKDQWVQFAEAQISGGGPISGDMVKDMAREMARLANDAKGRKELKRIGMIRRAQGRQIPVEMVADIDPNGSQNMEAPIGINMPRASAAADQPSPPQPPPGAPRVTNDAEYEALPSGTVFIDPNGVTRRKP